MGALLEACGFSVVSDEDISTLGASLSANNKANNRWARWLNVLRIAVADRATHGAIGGRGVQSDGATADLLAFLPRSRQGSASQRTSGPALVATARESFL
jgi:hypothetical protein